MKKTIYFLGNDYSASDNSLFIITPILEKELSGFDFVHLDPSEELPSFTDKKLLLIDTVININRVTLYRDPDKFILSPRNSVHDYDLPLNLRIMQKLGKLKEMIIIGIPPDKTDRKTINQIKKLILTYNFRFNRKRMGDPSQ